MRKKTLLTTVIAIITAVCLLTVGCGKSDDKTASNDVEASGEDMTTTAEDEVADALKEYGTDVETSIADDGTIYVVEAETDKSGGSRNRRIRQDCNCNRSGNDSIRQDCKGY